MASVVRVDQPVTLIALVALAIVAALMPETRPEKG
jgi:hypothetical protein